MADMVGRDHLLNNYMHIEDDDYDEWLARLNPSKNTTFRKMYHATPNKLTSLDRDNEIYLAPNIATANFTAARGGTDPYVYEVYYPTSLNLFNPRSMFKDGVEAQEVASFLQSYQDGFDEDLEFYDFAFDFAIGYFTDMENYTSEGLRILNSCGVLETETDLAIEQIINAFVMLYPSTEILGRNNSCLLSFGYQGRFEQEIELNAWVEIDDCSVCVFDQRLCKLGDLK